MVDWVVIATIGGLSSMLAARSWWRHKQQRDTAAATGLQPAPDLSHVSTALQRTALWTLSDGGFEQRVVSAVVERGGPSSHGVYRDAAGHAGELMVTAFELETLRERRGEWAWLPVEPPFRVGPVISVCMCELDRSFPHMLFKHIGPGDELHDDDRIERLGHIAKNARDRLGMKRSYPAEMPGSFPAAKIDVSLPDGWRVYATSADYARELIARGMHDILVSASRPDLVIELIEDAIVMYPATLVVEGSEGFADFTSLAIMVADAVLAASRSLSVPSPTRGLDAPV